MKPKDRGVVRILLVGEPSCGKTSLVQSLVTEEFSPTVQAKYDEITIPASVTPECVPTEIVDYSASVQTRDQLVEEIRQASVICLVYALDEANFVEQITLQWLPLIRSCFDGKLSSVPVVLVGNKLDLVSGGKLEFVLPLMKRFKEIETCIECSARTLQNLSEVFWFAQKAVLYPTAPLYDADTKQLTPECVFALTRIFRICDVDNDGYLSDKELEAFQERCFAIPLTPQSLLDVKHLIRNSTLGGIAVSGVTLKGFLYLHLIFIRKGRHETTWAVLRHFGYDNHLRLAHDFLFPRLIVPYGCSTELSPAATHFLHSVFTKYDLDGDECLSPAEISELMATCPQEVRGVEGTGVSMHDLGTCVETNSKGWITRRGFMAHWSLTAFLEPSQALEYLAYLGFTYQQSVCCAANAEQTTVPPSEAGFFTDFQPSLQWSLYGGPTASATGWGDAAEKLRRGIVVKPERRMDYIRGSSSRTVFYCRVYGTRKVGKTCLLQGLLGRGLRGQGASAVGGVCGRTSAWTAATGLPVQTASGNAHRGLLLHEVAAGQGEQMSAGEALAADVACLVYDSTDPESFRYVANVFLNFYRGTRVPCLLVASKADQPSVFQNYYLDPQEFCVKYNLPDPVAFSSMEVRPRFTNHAFSPEGQAEGARQRRSSADAIRSAGIVEKGSRWFLDVDQESPEGSPLSSRASGPSQRPLSATRGRSSTPSFTDRFPAAHGNGGFPLSTTRDDKALDCLFHPVYVKLVTLANYPNSRRLELSQPDYSWKLTLAATILAGCGFVAFRMIGRPHV